MSVEKPKRISKLLSKITLSDALAIAAFPVLAHLLIFIFYSGYFNVFRMPIQLIAFDFTSVFVVTAILLILAFIIYYWGDLLFSIFGIFPEPIGRKLRILLATIFFIVMVSYLYSDYLSLVFPNADYTTPLIGLILGIVLVLITEFRPPPGKGTYLERLKAADKLEREKLANEDPTDPIEKILRRARREYLLIAFFLFCMHSAGRYHAFTQTDFYIANTTPETIVLWMNNEKAVSASFDRNNRSVEPNFTFLDLTKTPNLKFRLERIGPLHFVVTVHSINPITTQPSNP